MLELLISSSVLILVLAILRLALRNRISARLQYALWLLVLVRLLVPVSFFHSPVSVAEAAAPVAERVWYASHMVIYTRNTAPVPEQAFSDPSEYEEGSVVTPGHALLLRDALLLIWNLGMIVIAVWFTLVNLRLARRLKRTRTPYAPDHTPPVYVAGGIPSPCLFGLFRPAVYLTEQAAADPVQARQIVAHEKTHLRHGDMIWALLRSVCLVIWWFDPLVWLAAALSRRDCELACDEGTIKALGEEARFDYGRTLVGMARVGVRPSDLLCGATTMTGGKKSLKERVARIADAPKMSVTVAVIVLLIAAVAVGCTYGGSSKAEPEIAVEVPALASAADAAVVTGPEVLGGYDREYWEEVDRELASFAYPADIEVLVSDDFDEDLPEDDIFVPLTIADYIYGTDSWQFQYNGEPIANEPFAVITLFDADGRTLRIMDDADALMIGEADGSITWATMPDGVDCADMIRHLLPWARGEYVRDESYAPEPGDSVAAAVPAPLPPELPKGWVNDYILEGDERKQALAMLMSFASPAEVSVNSVFGDVLPAENAAADFASFVNAHDWTVRYSPGPAANAPDASIILTNYDGSQLWIVNDLDYLALVLPEETFENNHPELHFYDGAADGDYLCELWTWAQGFR